MKYFLILFMIVTLPGLAWADIAEPANLASCAKIGGDWGRHGLSAKEFCNLPTRDGGKICHSKTDCESMCLIDKSENNAESGKCSERKSNFGCLTSLDNGGKQQQICID